MSKHYQEHLKIVLTFHSTGEANK